MSKARILVIDDHKGTVRAIERVLQRAGYQVLTALEGTTGLKKAWEEQPDLIILDIMMPGIDGYQVCRQLQNYPDTAQIPVLMLTGKGSLDVDDPTLTDSDRAKRILEKTEGFNAGATEFLTKPVRVKELVDRVKALVWLSSIKK